ncbi:MAG: FlgD immunoglobulin-like domain containing protein, partial [Candidatus Poribacteria bacterium]
NILPLHTALHQNYPNPFNPETWIPYQLADAADVTVEIYSVTGDLIKSINLGRKEAGAYMTKKKAICWDGRNELGEKVANGVYFYTLRAGEFRATRRMVILK